MEALRRIPEDRLPVGPASRQPIEITLPSNEVVGLIPSEHFDLVPTGIDNWSVVSERTTVVGIDRAITEPLKREGLAREVVRCIQDQRKKAGLEMEDRIVLCLKTDSPELKQAIDTHRDYIAAETLTVKWADSLPNETEVKIEGATLKIALAKV